MTSRAQDTGSNPANDDPADGLTTSQDPNLDRDRDQEQEPEIDPAQMSGLELLRWVKAHDSDEVPSIRRLLGMRFDDIDPGRVVMSLRSQPDFSNPHGTVHGGIAATLLDSVMGCAVHTTLPAGVSYTTLELHVNYIRSAHIDGHALTGTGTVIHTGRRTATAEGSVHDDAGKLIAHATTTCLILQGS